MNDIFKSIITIEKSLRASDTGQWYTFCGHTGNSRGDRNNLREGRSCVEETNVRHGGAWPAAARITTQLSQRGSCIGDQAYRRRRRRFCLRLLAGDDDTKAIYNVCRPVARPPKSHGHCSSSSSS